MMKFVDKQSFNATRHSPQLLFLHSLALFYSLSLLSPFSLSLMTTTWMSQHVSAPVAGVAAVAVDHKAALPRARAASEQLIS